MDEDKLLQEATIETIKEVAKDVYKEGISPILKPTSQALAVIPETILTLLYPFRVLNLYSQNSISKTAILLSKRLENVPQDDIIAPEPYIAVPALQQLSYSMDNESLREMYANLLAKAMNKNTKDDVHPSFVEIIKQLSPDEALLLKYTYNKPKVPINALALVHAALYERKELNGEHSAKLLLDKFYSDDLPKDFNCTNRKPMLDNLIRLQLLAYGRIQGSWDILMCQDHFKLSDEAFEKHLSEIEIKNNNRNDSVSYSGEIHKNGYYCTAYGINFAKTCILE